MSGIQPPYRYNYEAVAASQTDQVMGGTGALGDYLDSVICVVATAGANNVVSIKDGSGSAITILPASVTPGAGTYTIPIQAASSNGAWKVTT